MTSDGTPVGDLLNIGRAAAARLRAVGIGTADELRRVGALGAFRRIRAGFPAEVIPVCYVFALYGALTGCVWHRLPAEVRRRLKEQVRRTQEG